MVVGLLAVLGIPTLGTELVGAVTPPPPGWICVRDNPIATVQLWTPSVMANSPYLGSATGSYSVSTYGSFTFTAGPITLSSSTSSSVTAYVSSSNGAALGQFQLDTWTIYPVHNERSPFYQGCTQNYVAEITTLGNVYSGAVTLVPAGTTGDASEMTSFTLGGHDSIVFHNGWSRSSGIVETCGLGAWSYAVSQSTSTSLSVSVSATISGGTTVTASGVLGITVASGTGNDNSFSYYIPANSGIYSYYNLKGGQTGPINGALAWQWYPCITASLSPATQTVYFGRYCNALATFDSSATGGNGGPYAYSWNFGDGGTGTGSHVTHIYPPQKGTYTATVTATDPNGGWGSSTGRVTVTTLPRRCG